MRKSASHRLELLKYLFFQLFIFSVILGVVVLVFIILSLLIPVILGIMVGPGVWFSLFYHAIVVAILWGMAGC